VLGFKTFEDYCRKKWGFKRTCAFYMIESAKAIDNVHNCEQKPTTESQARPLYSPCPRSTDQSMAEGSQRPQRTAPKAHGGGGSFNLEHRKKSSPVKPGRATMPEPSKGLDENLD
jgi:hypothetical protein